MKLPSCCHCQLMSGENKDQVNLAFLQFKPLINAMVWNKT